MLSSSHRKRHSRVELGRHFEFLTAGVWGRCQTSWCGTIRFQKDSIWLLCWNTQGLMMMLTEVPSLRVLELQSAPFLANLVQISSYLPPGNRRFRENRAWPSNDHSEICTRVCRSTLVSTRISWQPHRQDEVLLLLKPSRHGHNTECNCIGIRRSATMLRINGISMRAVAMREVDISVSNGWIGGLVRYLTKIQRRLHSRRAQGG